MRDREVRKFIRCIAALPFLPINRIEAILDQLEEITLDKNSPFFDEFEQKKLQVTDYIERVWIR